MGLNVTYKGEQIAQLSATGTATLKLAGKTCEGDILLAYSAGGISGGGISGGGISGGSISGGSSDVVFYDSYDHSVVASYSAAEFARLSALPPNPEHAGLIAQGWNWTLENAKAYTAKYGKLTVGQMFVTDDGKTRIHIHLEPDRTTPLLGLCVNGSVSVDWGDGSDPDTLTGTSPTVMIWTPKHTYPGGGDYVISLTVNDGSIAFGGSNPNSSLLVHTAGTDRRNKAYGNDVKAVEFGSDVVKIGAYTFQHCYSLTHVTIPNGVDGVGTSAFQNCYSLQSITLPNGATDIGNTAFQKNYSLSYISVPIGVTRIGTDAFDTCHNLHAVTLPEGLTAIANEAFLKCMSMVTAVVPDTVTSIGTYAFNSCHELSKFIIPASVVESNANAFSSCSSLTEMTVPGNLATVPAYAFASCERLINITFMDGVESIETNALLYCYSLEAITIPASVTSIATKAFASCMSLAEVRIFAQTPPTLATNVFYDTPTDFLIYVPKGTLEAYKTASNWSTQAAKMREMEE